MTFVIYGIRYDISQDTYKICLNTYTVGHDGYLAERTISPSLVSKHNSFEHAMATIIFRVPLYEGQSFLFVTEDELEHFQRHYKTRTI